MVLNFFYKISWLLGGITGNLVGDLGGDFFGCKAFFWRRLYDCFFGWNRFFTTRAECMPWVREIASFLE